MKNNKYIYDIKTDTFKLDRFFDIKNLKNKIKCFFGLHLYLEHNYLFESGVKIHKCHHCNKLICKEVDELEKKEQLYFFKTPELFNSNSVIISGNNNYMSVESSDPKNSKINLKLNGHFKIAIYGKRL